LVALNLFFIPLDTFSFCCFLCRSLSFFPSGLFPISMFLPFLGFFVFFHAMVVIPPYFPWPSLFTPQTGCSRQFPPFFRCPCCFLRKKVCSQMVTTPRVCKGPYPGGLVSFYFCIDNGLPMSKRSRSNVGVFNLVLLFGVLSLKTHNFFCTHLAPLTLLPSLPPSFAVFSFLFLDPFFPLCLKFSCSPPLGPPPPPPFRHPFVSRRSLNHFGLGPPSQKPSRLPPPLFTLFLFFFFGTNQFPAFPVTLPPPRFSGLFVFLFFPFCHPPNPAPRFFLLNFPPVDKPFFFFALVVLFPRGACRDNLTFPHDGSVYRHPEPIRFFFSLIPSPIVFFVRPP